MLTLTAPSLSAPTGFVDGRMRNRGGGAPARGRSGRPATGASGQKPSPNNAEFNTGVLLLRPAKATMALVERWTASQLALMENHDMNDQTHFNKAVNDFGGREELGAYGAYACCDRCCREHMPFAPKQRAPKHDVTPACAESQRRVQALKGKSYWF